MRHNSTKPMLAYEASLPSLPIPTLESTASKYLESAKPHLTPSEFRTTSLAVQDFLSSPLVRRLQTRLEEHAANEEKQGRKNWLSEWWNDVAYMGYRDPVVVFVSYFYVHGKGREGISREERAAELIRAMGFFRDLVESERLEPEKVRDTPLAMSSYRWLFNSARIPTIPSDTARKYSPESNNHVLVLRKNRFYTLPTHTTSNTPLSIPQLTSLVQEIIQTADAQPAAPSIGALTSDNRDTWTQARKHLESIGNNKKTFEKVDSAILVLALDDTSPTTREELSWASWTGNKNFKGSGPGNRWFDKHQIIVWENARSGFLGEHSCMDGTPTLRMTEFILGSLASGKIPREEASSSGEVPKVQELKFELDEKALQDIKTSEQTFETLVGNHELEVLQYEKLGKNACKGFKVSPDATAQIIKQLAFHKLNNRPGVCYESAQTRKFALGRTEVIRAASSETKAFAEAMLDVKKGNEERLDLFKKAVNRHLQYAAWAADGQGVDRHLFGLKRLLKEGEETPRLYEDVAFSRSNHWELSTSNLSSKYLDGWGYGEVVPDGYGLSYSIGDEYIRWTMTCLKDMGRKGKGAKDLKKVLEESAEMVRTLLESAPKEAKAKL